MPRAILHVGTMKTGTTSIQAMLARNGAELSKQNHTYLGWPMRQSEAMSKAIAALEDPNSSLIISDEGLWHFMDTKRSDTKEIAELLAHYEVTVVVYLRRPDQFLNSWFLQGLKSGVGARTMTQFLASSFVKKGMRFAAQIERFEKLFGKGSICLRPYAKDQLVGGDVISDFLNVVGFSNVEFNIPKPANTTPDTDSMLIKSLMQGHQKMSKIIAQNLHHFQTHLSQHGYRGRSYNLLSRAEMEEFVMPLRPEFEFLQATYGGGRSPAFFSGWPELNTADDSLLALRWAQEALLGSSV